MAASIPPPTFEKLRHVCAFNRGSILLNLCANCSLFDWKQVDSESLQKCGRCKVLQYCSQQCQAEHWALVHKSHCQKMAWARQQSEEPVGIYSHHPFPDPEAAAGVQSGSADTTEVLVALVQRFLMQIKSTDLALFLHIEQLPQLEDMMEMNRRKIWAHRKLYPEQYKDADILDGFSASYRLFPNTKVFAPHDEACLETWSILHLVWGRLIGHWVIVRMNCLKDPRQAMPQDAWEDFIEDDVGLFPVRVKAMVDAIFSNQIISFKDLLQVFCGGSLVQRCSFCPTIMTVEAVCGEGKGACVKGVPVLSLLPHLTQMYSCGAPTCQEEIISKERAWSKWHSAVSLTYQKLAKNRCNFCFKVTERVHR